MTIHMNGRSDTGRHAFEKELLAVTPALLSFAISLTGRRDKADDLVQDTLFKALRKYESFEMGTSLKAWTFTIMRNEFYSNLRKTKTRSEHGWIEGLDDSLAYSTHQLSSGGETYDFRKHLAYIASLPQQQCDAFIAVCYLGMDYIQASAVMGVAVGTMKSRVSRARVRLVELVESNTKIVEANFESFKTATRGMSPDHPFYPIAEAYEELFAESRDVERVSQKMEGLQDRSQPEPLLEKDRIWQQMIASGAFEEDTQDLSVLMQTEFEE